jgi:hypothetical protein
MYGRGEGGCLNGEAETSCGDGRVGVRGAVVGVFGVEAVGVGVVKGVEELEP